MFFENGKYKIIHSLMSFITHWFTVYINKCGIIRFVFASRVYIIQLYRQCFRKKRNSMKKLGFLFFVCFIFVYFEVMDEMTCVIFKSMSKCCNNSDGFICCLRQQFLHSHTYAHQQPAWIMYQYLTFVFFRNTWNIFFWKPFDSEMACTTKLTSPSALYNSNHYHYIPKMNDFLKFKINTYIQKNPLQKL